MQIGLFFNQRRCTGCFACAVACKDWHDIPAGQVKRLRIETLEQGTCPDVTVSRLFAACYHCARPPCAAVCPAKAIGKDGEDGIVTVDRQVCLGRDSCGGLCLEACPYGAPQFAARDNAKMEKCDLCRERLRENKKPACVDACPVRALDAGPIDQLTARYGAVRAARGWPASPPGVPSIVFIPK
ncbi:MAG: 4Fe-4S dicluster domain-containing protein [Peptococcaceae bacterium]|jgi:anaerobic dimethyl sulfoxide reductase subunit B (iron-sulfur subunit)|nr:4Fe-4S dicluster domain-containing protein [Peptococcaceae bacterium]